MFSSVNDACTCWTCETNWFFYQFEILNHNTKYFIHEDVLENIVCELMTILSKGRWVKEQWIKAIIMNNRYLHINPTLTLTRPLVVSAGAHDFDHFTFSRCKHKYICVYQPPLTIIRNRLHTKQNKYKQKNKQKYHWNNSPWKYLSDAIFI